MANVDWKSYSDSYDMVLSYNPAYQDLITQFKNEISKWKINKEDIIADVGAGTGNFSLILAENFQQAQILHIEPDEGMLNYAKKKSAERGLDNISFINKTVDELDFKTEYLSAIVSIHALYTFPDPLQSLYKFYNFLKPNGHAFLCDIGRECPVSDWLKFFIKHLVKTEGIYNTAKIIWKSREATRYNKSINRQRKNGTFWSHSHEEFCKAVSNANFTIEESKLCFRNYSDLIICKK